MGYTQGEWKSRYNESGGYDCMTDSFDIYVIGANGKYDKRVIADLDLAYYSQKACEPLLDKSEAQANAHLIAAAPDMYEALKAILPMVTTEWNGPIQEMARKAIEKAEGKLTGGR